MLAELVRALDAGDHDRAADRTADVPPDELATMWSELIDSVGPLEGLGDPTVAGSEATVPLDLGGQPFVARGQLTDGGVASFEVTMADDASTVSVLLGRLRQRVSGLFDSVLGDDRSSSDAEGPLAEEVAPRERARVVAELLGAERYDDVAAALDPESVGDDLERVASAFEQTWTQKVSSFEGVVRTASDGESGYAFVDTGDGLLRVEVVTQDGSFAGLLLGTREETASMIAGRVFRGERFADLPEVLGGDLAAGDRVGATAERVWTDLVAEHGAVESVGEPSLDEEGAAVVDLQTAEASIRLRVAFDDTWTPSGLRLVAPDETVAWEWERDRSGHG